jgi:hypothetical protein
MLNQTKLSWEQTTHYDAQISQQVINLERQYDLLRFQVDGWCVWPVLRFQIGTALRKNGSLHKHTKRDRLQQIPSAIHDFYKVFTLEKRRYVVRTYDSNLSEKRDGFYLDIFFDDLLIELENWFKIETVSNPTFSTARKAMLLRTDMTSTFFGSLANLLARYFCPEDIHVTAQNMASILCKQEKLKTFTPDYICFTLAHFHWSLQLYKLLFSRTSPQHLMLVTAYTDHAIVAAAKAKDVKVIEFQHGFVAPWHLGYSWSEYAVPYRKQMPIPDKIFLYGEHWRQALLTNGFWDKELMVVGSLRMDSHRNQQRSKPDGVFRLLLTTQLIDIENLLNFVSQFLREYTDTPPVELCVKLHPGETTKVFYENAFKEFSNVRILLSEESPSTFDLLLMAHLHLSIYSTCHYEALALGVPTVILPLAGHENVLSIRQCDYAFLVETPQDLVSLVKGLDNLEVPRHIGDMFFTQNALTNMKVELSQ